MKKGIWLLCLLCSASALALDLKPLLIAKNYDELNAWGNQCAFEAQTLEQQDNCALYLDALARADTELLGLLQQWHQEVSTIGSASSLALNYLSFGHSIRSYNISANVSRYQFDVFNYYNEQASQLLEAVQAAQPDLCFAWFGLVKTRQLLSDEAIEFWLNDVPEDCFSHMALLSKLTKYAAPRWGGSQELVNRIARRYHDKSLVPAFVQISEIDSSLMDKSLEKGEAFDRLSAYNDNQVMAWPIVMQRYYYAVLSDALLKEQTGEIERVVNGLLRLKLGSTELNERIAYNVYDDYLPQLQQQVDLAPDDQNLWRYLASALENSGDLAGAHDAIEKAIELVPTYGGNWNTLNHILIAEDKGIFWDHNPQVSARFLRAVLPASGVIYQCVNQGSEASQEADSELLQAIDWQGFDARLAALFDQNMASEEGKVAPLYEELVHVTSIFAKTQSLYSKRFADSHREKYIVDNALADEAWLVLNSTVCPVVAQYIGEQKGIE